jgi:hypothetical protein
MIAGGVFCFISVPIAMFTSFLLLKDTRKSEPDAEYMVMRVITLRYVPLISSRPLF